MHLDEQQLRDKQNRRLIEDIEKATLRLVVHALLDFKDHAIRAFSASKDDAELIAEELTREALDQTGMPRTFSRLEGDVDYKRARHFVHPEYSIKQALLVDSKAEKDETNFSIQLAQTSMRIRCIANKNSETPRLIRMKGTAPAVLVQGDTRDPYLTTTIIVRYDYEMTPSGGYRLRRLAIVAIPNGLLQAKYNPKYANTIWQVGRHSTQRGEKPRIRVSTKLIEQKAPWRIQYIECQDPAHFTWRE